MSILIVTTKCIEFFFLQIMSIELIMIYEVHSIIFNYYAHRVIKKSTDVEELVNISNNNYCTILPCKSLVHPIVASH